MADPKQPKIPKEIYTVDHSTGRISTIPSVTKLLYVTPKKNLKDTDKASPSLQPTNTELKKESPPPALPAATETQARQTPPPQPPPMHAPEIKASAPPPLSVPTTAPEQLEAAALSLPPLDSPSPSSAQSPRKPVKRRHMGKKLIEWSLKQLARGKDPLAKGLAFMINRGVNSALFLAIKPPPDGAPVPVFTATATVQPGKKRDLWAGMQWNPVFEVEMWNRFIATGYVEFPPPGTTTNLKSTRNVTRAAFGILPDEWLLFARVGPADACRGIVAMVSPKSLSADLVSAMETFSKSVN